MFQPKDMVGYEINPIITVGAAMIGLVSGGYYHLPGRGGDKRTVSVRIIFFVFLSHILGSVFIKTLGLSIFYDMPLGILMLWRLLNYVIIGTLETVLLCCLMNNKAIRRQIFIMNGSSGKEREKK